MKETLRKENGLLDIKKTLKVLNKLTDSLNLLLVKSNKTYLLPDVEIEEIINQWNKYKDIHSKVDQFCELYVNKWKHKEIISIIVICSFTLKRLDFY